MKLLYVHDHKLRKKNGLFYTTGGFSDEITSRYSKVFGNMTLLCRTFKTQDITGCTKIKNKNLKIIPLSNNTIFPSKKLFFIIKEAVIKSDMVMVRLPSILGIYVALYCILNRKKYSVEVVGSAFGSYWYKSLLGKIVALPLELFNKIAIKKASYVLYVSDNYLQKEYPTNGIKCACSDVVLEDRNIEILHKRIEKIKSNNSFLTIGTLGQVDYKYKGHKTVIKVIARLKKEGINIIYRLAGSGKTTYLKKLAKKYEVLENIVLDGQIEHSVVVKWLDDIDIYLQPSLTEGMPRSVIEALYRGCPCIVSNAGGMVELMESENIFKKSNANELYNILKKIDKEKLIKMAKRNYQFSEKFIFKSLELKRNNFYIKIKDDKNEKMVY